MKHSIKASLLALISAGLLNGCELIENDDDPKLPAKALVQTVAPDYSSSEVAAIDVESQQVINDYFIKAKSDYTIASYLNNVYHIGRYGIDTIDKYSNPNLDALMWSFSTQDNEDSTSRNPYALTFVHESKAYLIRYGSEKVWIVNPEATQAEDFKIGELDLSSYVEEDFGGTPNPSAAIVHEDKLYIAMQRLDTNWSAHTAYVAVFDVNTDEEIETNANSEDAVKGIPLTGLNPLENSLTAFGSEVYVTSRDAYSSFDFSGSKIESIDTDSFRLREVVSAVDVGANIHATAIVDGNHGYFYTTTGAVVDGAWTEMSTLYQFGPSSGEIIEKNVANTGSEDINFMTLDENNYLWLSIGSAQMPGVEVLDTTDNTHYSERLLTELNPGKIVFLK
jgi:hypothetical protein